MLAGLGYLGVFEMIPHALYAIDNSGSVIYINEKAKKLLWCESERFENEDCRNIFKCSYTLGGCPILEGIMHGAASPLSGQVSYLAPDGSCIDGKHMATRLNLGGSGGSGCSGCSGTVRDIWAVIIDDCTSDKVTSEFVAVAAHQLRTPMTTIKAYVSLLKAERFGLIDEPKLKALDAIDRNIDRLVEFTTDLLTLSRIESGQLKIHLVKADVVDIVAAVVEKYWARFADDSVRIAISTSGDTIAFVDEDRLYQVLVSLLDNAVRYAPKGSEVKIHIEGGSGYCTMTVSNTGETIPESKLLKIFDKFYQCESVDSALYIGKGLGLAICKGLIGLMDGQIWATNNPDERGVTFHLRLVQLSN